MCCKSEKFGSALSSQAGFFKNSVGAVAERGVPLAVVQSMVGHMSARVTRYYTHISTQAARQAVELLDRERIVGKFVGNEAEAKSDAAKLLNYW
jgi:hypothetical protein